MKVVLYSTGCPQCRVLKGMLEFKGIDFKVNDDLDQMLERGIRSVPQLELTMGMQEAIEWLKHYPGSETT